MQIKDRVCTDNAGLTPIILLERLIRNFFDGFVWEVSMAIRTPGLENQHQTLAALSSRYIQVDEIPWQETRFKGISIKVLMEDPETGLQTVLTKMESGAVLADHQHVQLEQSWVLEGSLVDHEGACTAGNYVWRPAGSRHSAHAPHGALVLGFFLKPNHFF